ncbi:MAG: hypothetical protein IPG12_04900 [Saprospiraceae bacterium]|nr:hypothetical protein [Saprospiraceae bacterium]
MKQIFSILLIINSLSTFCQSFNEDKTAFTNFVKRMYNADPFEGIKVIDDYDHQYFMSVISLETSKYTNPSTMNRVAQLKAQSQANVFFNGSSISSDLIIKTTDQKIENSNSTIVETIESIKENALGFSQGMELLINFDDLDGKRMVFIYYREIKKDTESKQ